MNLYYRIADIALHLVMVISLIAHVQWNGDLEDQLVTLQHELMNVKVYHKLCVEKLYTYDLPLKSNTFYNDKIEETRFDFIMPENTGVMVKPTDTDVNNIRMMLYNIESSTTETEDKPKVTL